MDLYCLDPVDSWGQKDFAHAITSEDIDWENPDEVCETCLEPMHRRRLGPITITWVPGCGVIGDLVKLNRDGFVVTEHVKLALERAGLTGYTAWPVKIKEPKRRARLRRPIVAYPYEGPPLWDIYVDIDQMVRLIPEHLEYRGRCSACGRERSRAIGVNEEEFHVDRASWHGQDFMLAPELNCVIVSSRVADVVRDNKFTNVKIVPLGRISD